MAKKTSTSSHNGHDRLEEAIAILIQNEASFVARLSETQRLHTEFERETKSRWTRLSVF
jgi:hypothetical protein